MRKAAPKTSRAAGGSARKAVGKSAARPAAGTTARKGGKAARPVPKAAPKAKAKAKARPLAGRAAAKTKAAPARARKSPPQAAPPSTRPAAGAGRRTARGRPARALAPRAVPGLNEEDQIRAAKFLPRELPRRLFEEERFLFPESYGQDRIRLLVRDPDWIFAYWDVKPQSLEQLAKSLGERALALSRLTLRVVDPVSGGSSDILLPPGARWWYVRTDAARRTYRAELGVTLPSGQFRKLAESNTVVTPRVGPSSERARRRMSYRDAGELAPADAAAAVRVEREAGLAAEPWAAESVDGAAAAPAQGERPARGGASDAFRPGGASDTFRR